jgi:hypothetical protein
MRLGKSNDGGYGIVISDAEGRRRATFFGGDSGAGMHMFQKSDTAQMSLVTRPNGTALVLRDLPGKPRAVINVSNAAVQLEMRDAIGQVVFLAPPAQHDPNRIIP